MRLFTAIPLPEEIKMKIGEITKGRLPVPYINTSQLHITLNFFGEMTDRETEKVKNTFEQNSNKFKKVSIQFLQLMKFRDQIHITVEPSVSLLNLQSILQKEFEDISFSFQDRAYYPHLKLSNLHMDKVMNPQRKLENFPQAELKQLNFEANKIALFQSQLLLHHAKHTPIAEVELI